MRGKTAAAEDLTAKKELALEVIRRLKAEYPDAGCTLDYDHAWQLLVSVRLAAQCTDARVNVVVQDLFEKYPSVAALAEAEPEDIEAIVKPCGLGRSKARDISACMRRLRDDYGCKVPTTFDELFDGVYSIHWEELLPADAAFPVTGSSLNSQLSSVPACQSIIKKAVVKRLMQGHRTTSLPETGAEYKIRFMLRKNVCEIMLDTTGDGLHKRGYRRNSMEAPIRETLAATIADLGRVRRDSLVEDPFCGSGTLLIEAAQKAMNIAPGLKRRFAAERYSFVPAAVWAEQRQKALSESKLDVGFEAFGYDIDPAAVALANANAKLAGVDHLIHFQQRPVAELSHPKKYGFLITNPPYGERLEDKKDLPALYQTLGERYRALDSWSMYLITSYEDAERYLGKKADKNRKIYNGMLKTYFYQYAGPKPPRREKEQK